MERGDIVITPFNKENLSTSSYDVTLGEHYFIEQENLNSVYNPFSKKSTDQVWGTEPRIAKTAEEVFQDFPFKYEGIAPDDRIILIEPGETILGHTNEFIGGRNHITTMMKARSSLGRNFIEVCKCAGWGDVGYTNRWTMEITNNAKQYHIPLVVGRRIAQIVFFETGETNENTYIQGGKYQKTESIEILQKTWDPLSMLPKMYNDREVRHNN